MVLFGLGALVIVRSVRGDLHGERHDPGHLRRRMLAPLGLSAGFIDAVGGGGWGPVATPTLLAAGRVEPRLVIGSVSAAELLVTVAASAGFLIGLGGEGIEAPLVLALLAGGVVAAPIAAWLVRHADASVLGVVVGTLLLVTNTRTLMLEVGVPGPVRLPVLLAIAAAGAVVAVRVRRLHGPASRGRPRPPPRRPAAADAPDAAVPPTAEATPAEPAGPDRAVGARSREAIGTGRPRPRHGFRIRNPCLGLDSAEPMHLAVRAGGAGGLTRRRAGLPSRPGSGRVSPRSGPRPTRRPTGTAGTCT